MILTKSKFIIAATLALSVSTLVASPAMSRTINPFAEDPGEALSNNFLAADDIIRRVKLRRQLTGSGGPSAVETGSDQTPVFHIDPDEEFRTDIFSRSDHQDGAFRVEGGVVTPLSPSQVFHPDPDALHE